MPKVTEHKEAHLRRTIRDIMAVDPLISIRALQKAVEAKINRPIDFDYTRKLVKSVSREMAVIADQEKIEDRIGYLRETNRLIRNELFRIAFPSPTDLDKPNANQRIRALDLIAKIDRNQVQIEMDLGLYTRHLGQLDVELRAKPLDDQTRSRMIETWKQWFSVPIQPRKTALNSVIDVESTNIPHGPPKQQPSPESAQSKPREQPVPVSTGTGLVPTE